MKAKQNNSEDQKKKIEIAFKKMSLLASAMKETE